MQALRANFNFSEALLYRRNKAYPRVMNSRIIKATRFLGHLNIVRRSIRYRIFKILKMDFSFNVNFYGYKYIGNLNNFIDRSVFYFGAHEREHLEFSKPFVAEGTVIDCGANTGNHSLFYSAFAPKVLSIEASQVKAKELQERISLNQISNIILFNCGVGSCDNIFMPFYESQSDNSGVSSFVEGFSALNSFSDKVLIRTLDSIIDELQIGKVGFVKIDVEGFDYEVLKGAKKLIQRDLPIIQIEFSPRDFEKLLEFLNEFPMYSAKSLIVNRPILFFNRYRGKLITFDPSMRSEVFLFPEKYS